MTSEDAMTSHETAARPRRQRRHDPDRPQRIAEVVEELIAERGIEGLSHRAIAERADVSLSSTTYHYKDREALIRVGLQRTVDRFAAYMREWAAEHAGDTPEELADALADAVVATATGPGRIGAVVEYELYVAALRRPGLRDLAARDTSGTIEALTPLVGPVRAAALQAAMNGLCLQSMAAPTPPDRAEIRAVLGLILGVSPA
ncbi:TetR family transcriptional regulator [Nocardia sp. CDC159]|uniref:TetR family transcriptional regulator n=1 Tax=Nocardia pulmonis TaxID=2951408 RepID=A0A9X2E6Q0_9NOCA|nr:MULTISPECIES: TetR family transcriptional regulator [Nocardia]MCM6774650.1 TetR family transcriptional regulator [Nocardia pulmonis]MCM6787285.1 TetR family transcriptional regulator [Nocardia sp. CDC159]